MNLKNSIKKFIEYTHLYIIFFLHKNIKRRIILIFSYCALCLLIICILLLFFKIFPEIMLCQKKADQQTFVESGIFSVRHLNDFYAPEKSLVDNLRKLCFSEGIGAVYAWLSEPKLANYDKPVDLRRIIGKACYENFKTFSQTLMINNCDLDEISLFLIGIFNKESAEYLYSIHDDFFFFYEANFGHEWHPKKSFGEEVQYFADFWVIEELAPLRVESLSNLYHTAFNSLKFLNCFEKNGVYFTSYTDEAKNILKDVNKAYIEKDSISFSEETGSYLYKLKHALPHLHGLRELYQNKITSYTFDFMNLGFEENCGVNFFLMFNYLENCIAIYEQILKEIGAVEIINHILYYPSVSTGRYYLDIALNEISERLELNLETGAFEDTNGFVYVEFPFGDIRIRRIIKKYLNWIYKAGYIKDQQIVTNYKNHARIFSSILIDGKELLETEKLTYEQALESINFIKKILKEISSQEEILAKKCFCNIDQIRTKKRLIN